MILISPKPRLNRSNLGTFLVDGKIVRAYSRNGTVFFRIHRAKKVVSMSLQDIYANAAGQLTLKL